MLYTTIPTAYVLLVTGVVYVPTLKSTICMELFICLLIISWSFSIASFLFFPLVYAVIIPFSAGWVSSMLITIVIFMNAPKLRKILDFSILPGINVSSFFRPFSMSFKQSLIFADSAWKIFNIIYDTLNNHVEYNHLKFEQKTI